MRPSVFASFPSASEAEKAIGALLDHGVKGEDISVVFPESYRHDELIDHAKQGITTTTAEDAGVGAAVGAGVGLGMGALAALASLAVPGFGLVFGGGALATALAGAAGSTAAGAIAGGVTGYLKDLGIAGSVSENYSKAIREGGALLSVTVPSNGVSETEVSDICVKYNGCNIHTVEFPPQNVQATPSIDEERDPIVVDRETGQRLE
jgi:hypothetical protein